MSWFHSIRLIFWMGSLESWVFHTSFAYPTYSRKLRLQGKEEQRVIFHPLIEHKKHLFKTAILFNHSVKEQTGSCYFRADER